MIPPLGIIEGYFGRAWSWDDRGAVIARLAPAGYCFYHYAPKIDAKLRRKPALVIVYQRSARAMRQSTIPPHAKGSTGSMAAMPSRAKRCRRNRSPSKDQRAVKRIAQRVVQLRCDANA
jgi:beta-N-acetylglucosaminidase